MLRILKGGRPISLKEQDKLVNAPKSKENVGRPVNFDRPAVKARPRYPGLKTPKVKKDAQSTKAK